MNVQEILQDPVEFIKRLNIRLKDGSIEPFGKHILPQQIDLIRAIHENNRVAIIKSRQIGISTVVRAYSFWQTYTGHNISSAIISNKQRSSNALLDIDRRFLAGLPQALRTDPTVDSSSALKWPHGAISAFSGAAANDRGYSINTAHFSEFAFIDDAADVLASMLASVSSGKVILESTPNHYGDHLHKIAMDAMYSDAWKVIMLPWSIFPEYSTPAPKGFVPDGDEQKLVVEHKLTNDQLWWRRCKIDEMKDLAKFKREYPLTLEEAYSLSDKNFFVSDELAYIQELPDKASGLSQFQGMKNAHRYVIGVDPAGGTGNDYSVARVMDVSTLETVAIYSSNTTSISEFTEKTVSLANEYQKCLIVFEENNHGHGFKQKLDALNYFNYKPFTTTMKSKIAIYDTLRTYVYEKMLPSLDSITVKELRALVKDEALAPKHPDGAHDDRVITLCLCIEGLKHVQKPLTPLERIMLGNAKPTQGSSILQQHPLRNSS